jgi:hypothetical protein
MKSQANGILNIHTYLKVNKTFKRHPNSMLRIIYGKIFAYKLGLYVFWQYSSNYLSFILYEKLLSKYREADLRFFRP